jgi:hypothetical protein
MQSGFLQTMRYKFCTLKSKRRKAVQDIAGSAFCTSAEF